MPSWYQLRRTNGPGAGRRGGLVGESPGEPYTASPQFPGGHRTQKAAVLIGGLSSAQILEGLQALTGGASITGFPSCSKL